MGDLYTNMKIFHFKDKIDSLSKLNSNILSPVHIRIKPTNVCNHNCEYCAYRAEQLQLGQDMVIRDSIPKDKMMEIIDDLIKMDVKAVTFSGGGEPFCYPHLLDTVKKLSETQIKFATLTNGALMKGEVARIFALYGTWVRVSIDGWNDESYSDYRGASSFEFSKVLQNIRDFKAYSGKCYLGASIIVDKKNAPHIYELISKLKNAGVDSVKIAPCIISNDGKKNNEYHAHIFDLVQKQILTAKAEMEEDKFEIYNSYHTQLESFEKKYDWCPYLQILPIIGADLNIYPCQDKAYNLKDGLIGSIKNQRFKDFWFSDKNNFFKINPNKVCNHHCVADSKNKSIFNYLGVDQGHLEFV